MSLQVTQSDLRLELEPTYARQHGCAWFLWPAGAARDPQIATGIASIGGQKAFRFRHWKELPEGVMWWTNLTQAEAWSLGQWARLRESGFLGADWLGLIGEWGFPADEQGMMEGCAAWSETIARLGEWLIAQPSVEGRTWQWGEGSLAENVALLWQGAPLRSAPDPTGRVLKSTYLERVETLVAPHDLMGLRKMSLSFPRWSYFSALWPQRHPVEGFDHVALETLPRDNVNRRKWVIDQTLPLLVQIDDVTPAAGQEIAFGLFWGKRGKRSASGWMDAVWLTGEELQQAMAFSEFTIQAVFRGRGWSQTPPPAGWPGSAEPQTALDGASVALGLLAKAGWEGASIPPRAPATRLRPDPSARAVWWRAAERKRAFEAALKLEQGGVRILGYGRGELSVAIDPGTPSADLAELFRSAGLVLPAALASALPVDFSKGVHDPQTLAHWLRAHGTAETLLQIDRLCAPWKSSGGLSEVRGVLERAVQGLLKLDPQAPPAWKQGWSQALRAGATRAVALVKPPKA